MTAADIYTARVAGALSQRTRLRGEPPPGDLFAALPADHPLLRTEARRSLEPNLAVLASHVEPADTVLDVGGGAGRLSLPLALRCHDLINVDPSAAMGSGFAGNAERAGITNVRFIEGDWLATETPPADVVLVNHVTYFIRAIVPFIEKLQATARRRVVITVNSPPPPAWNAVLFDRIHGEAEAVVPGHLDLLAVLREMGVLPDVRVLPSSVAAFPPAPTREAAVDLWLQRVLADQWAFWPPSLELAARGRAVMEDQANTLFEESADGYQPRWVDFGREVLITWKPRH